VSGRNQCYALPELQQWETATTEHYVWGDPAAIQAYGKGLDTAGHDLGAIADSLTAIDVGEFWTGDAANAFTDLKRRVTPAVRGLSDLHKDSSTALNTWQQHLGVYQEDCAAAITTGRNGWHLYQTTSCDNQDARIQMNNGKTGITNAESGRDTAGRTCRSALEAAAAKADVPTAPPTTPPADTSTLGVTPSGRAPVPFTGPIPAGQPRPYVDPANGRIVVPEMGPYATGKRPWVYQN